MRLVFAGTPEFAAKQLQAILDDGQHEVIAVYTQPDRPAGRGKKLQPSAVKQLALDHNLPVKQPKSLRKAEAQRELASFEPDLLVVVAYGLILPQAVLDIPRKGCVNVHASLLPRWRGAAPIQRAIEAGDSETGITLMQMDAGLDTGPMLLKNSIGIEPTDTAGTLHDKLAELGQHTLTQGLNGFSRLEPEAQRDNESTYASKIEKADAILDWRQSAEDLELKIRAMNPVPVCTAEIGEHRIKIWSAKTVSNRIQREPAGTIVSADKTGICVVCGLGQLMIKELQMPGKRAMSAADILNSRASLFAPGQRFSL